MSDIAAAVEAWRSDLRTGRAGAVRRVGTWMLALGSVAMLLAMFATPPWASIGAACALTGALLCRAPLLRLPWLWIGLVYGGWIVASGLLAWTQGIEGGRWRPAAPAWTWLATPLIALGLAEPRARRAAGAALTIAAAAAVAVAAAQFCIGLGSGPLRIDPDGLRWKLSRGFSEHHLTFGLACAILLACSMPDRAASGLGALAAWTARIVALAGLCVSGSRAAVLGAGAGAWASLSARGRRWALIGLGLVLIGGIAVAARFAITEPGRLERSLRFEDGRWPIWSTSLHLAEQRPLTGWGGKDGFKVAYRSAFPEVNPGVVSEFPNGAPHAHSSVIAIVAEYGIPALALHLAFWGSALAWLWTRRRDAPAAWQAGIGAAIAAFVGGMFEPYATRAVQGIAIHAALGFALALALSPRTDGAPCPPPPSR